LLSHRERKLTLSRYALIGR